MRNIIIDCDPGIDDAVAIAVAAAHADELNLKGIVTVSGNQGVDKVTDNALRLTDFLGIPEVPVAKGSPEPLVRKNSPASGIHGSNGLGEVRLPDTDKKPVSEHGVRYLASLITSLPEGEKVTLIPTGPLTDIALLLKVYPEVRERIELVCLMGGTSCGGNVTAAAEFNVWHDPEAAKIVFDSGLPTVMCGLDVTLTCGFEDGQISEMQESSSAVLKAYGEMLRHYFKSVVDNEGKMVAVHDAVTVTYLLHPEWFDGKYMNVDVDCSLGPGAGQTICDARGWMKPEAGKGVKVLLEADTEKVQKFWLEALYSYR